MSYIPSVNIEHNTSQDFQYIVTENAKLVAGNIVNSFNAGHHSFSIIGTYGTGKSSFILALEDDLANGRNEIVKRGVFGRLNGFAFLNIVGDYCSLNSLLNRKLNSVDENPINALSSYYQKLRQQNKFLIIVVDEFGKLLEYAANNNPERELYFLQKLTEFINVPSRNILFITTLHQNFGSYASKLTEVQRNEWLKVKGRFKEIVFVEPVEQLLALTAKHLESSNLASIENDKSLRTLYDLGRKNKIVSRGFDFKTVAALYPLDPISAVCLTLAIQRYGQNERSLFSFLTAKGQGSLSDFVASLTYTYNVACVYDYISYSFYSAITELNGDSVGWRALHVAIERMETANVDSQCIADCLKLIKTIGLINMFFNGIVLDRVFLETYGKYALGLNDVSRLIEKLISLQIIRFAKYKSQFVLYDGSNIDIEHELYKAASIVPTPSLTVEEVIPFIHTKAVMANASYYRSGTPRYFEFRAVNEPETLVPLGEIDGYVQLVFPLGDIEDKVKATSKEATHNAVIYGYFRNTSEITKRLYEIKKIQYVIDNVAFDDRVALAELNNQKHFETQKLNEAINAHFIAGSEDVVWYFRGEPQDVKCTRDFNKLLSTVCDSVYTHTPVIKNELFNRHKLSSAISLARVNLLDAMINHSDEEAFGINGFPPEKTIYQTLLRDTGIHHQDDNGNWSLGAPTSEDVESLWAASVDFIRSSVDKPRKLSDLVKILQTAPYKLKQGVVDFWIPIFLYVNQQDFALYNGKTFVLSINKEVFELIQKRIGDFTVKAYAVSGVKLEFFKRYRQFLRKDDGISVSSDSLIETVKPFFHFYRGLNAYAKRTRKFDSAYTAKFRDILSDATDPAKTFFEDLPAALGYKDLNSAEFIEQYHDLIRQAVKELNTCYDALVDRIEERITEHLGISADFGIYKPVLEKRYGKIDARILTAKSRAFLDRILSPSATKKEFVEKLAIVINDKRLDETSDSDESLLIHQMLHIFSELERYSALVSQDGAEDCQAFNFELATNKGSFSKSQTYRLPKTKEGLANKVVRSVEQLLTNDKELDICILLKLLNDRVK